jgi:hypothetical protein
MPLTLRPTKLETSPVYQHLKDYCIFEDGSMVGRIFEQRPGATGRAVGVEHLRNGARPPTAQEDGWPSGHVRGRQGPICRELGSLQGRGLVR